MSESKDDRARRLLTGAAKRNVVRRFYKQAEIGGDSAPFRILLDGRAIKTPMKAALEMPYETLANAVAGEWNAQGEDIIPESMPLTRLANTAIDRVGAGRLAIADEIVEYAGSDLVCYRADRPEGLVELQNDTWDPLLAWMAKELGARFVSVTGLVHETQPEPTVKAIERYLGDCSDFELTAVHNLTALTGSCVLAACLRSGRIDGDEAWDAAHVDEDWQIEQWGPDEDAEARRAVHRREFDAALAFLGLLS